MRRFLLLLGTGFLIAGCSQLHQEPNVVSPLFPEGLSEVAPEDFPAKIEQLEAIADNHESLSVRAQACYYLALAHIHPNNPSPDYSQAVINLERYEAIKPESESREEIAIWKSLLTKLDSSLRELEKLKADYARLNQEYQSAVKNRRDLNLEKKKLSQTIETQAQEIKSLEEKIKKLDSLYIEIEKKKKKKKK